MPNVMVALPNIGGDLCSTPQNFGRRSLLDCASSRILYCEHSHLVSDNVECCGETVLKIIQHFANLCAVHRDSLVVTRSDR